MSKIDKNEELVANYLLNKSGINAFDDYVFKDICPVKLNNEFGLHVKDEQYKSVVGGEGNESEKIDKAYSSSLQSFLIFSAASENNSITIKDVEYTKVLFEYENPVINPNHPSSMDVVLLNEETGNIAFVESKLVEIPRDSSIVMHKNRKMYAKNYVVGQSYFNDKYNKDGPGYLNTLKLSEEDQEGIGIFKTDTKIVKKQLCSRIGTIDGNKYVYAYGIKQILAHVIGIAKFKSVERYSEEDNIPNHKIYKHITFIELHNSFPNLECSDLKNKINDFENHCRKVKNKLIEKGIVGDDGIINMFEIMSYQDLYEDNKVLFNKYPKIVNYYHLNKEQEN